VEKTPSTKRHLNVSFRARRLIFGVISTPHVERKLGVFFFRPPDPFLPPRSSFEGYFVNYEHEMTLVGVISCSDPFLPPRMNFEGYFVYILYIILYLLYVYI
jgi:hypothetical protein